MKLLEDASTFASNCDFASSVSRDQVLHGPTVQYISIVYSGTPLMQTPLGPSQNVRIIEVSSFQRVVL